MNRFFFYLKKRLALLCVILVTFFFLNILIACKEKHEINGRENALVTIKKNKENWQLYYNKVPFFIKGAHGTAQIELVKEIGGNSIIAYDDELSDSLINKADSLGIKIAVSLNIAKPRFENVDYSDPVFILEQRNRVRNIVKKYSDSPTILLWIIGNELNLMKTNMIKVWAEVNHISKMIHTIDPNHPTTTTIAQFPTYVYQPLQVKLFAKDLDFISMNVYNFASRIKREYDSFIWGSEKAFLVTEWSGHPFWKLDKTEWDAIIQPSSTDNAQQFFKSYTDIFEPNKKYCIGGYVFYWGQKQERTHTTFSILLKNKYKTQAVENIQYHWTGKWPTNWCPRIDSCYIDSFQLDKHYFESNKEYLVNIPAYDPDNDPLTFEWEIKKEAHYLGNIGGEGEKMPEIITKSDTTIPYQESFFITSPTELGPYRLFVYIYDDHNYVATANIPFYVIGN